MNPSFIYPWQQSQWKQLLNAKSKQKLAHALLLIGSSGLGKREFAIAWAKTLLCTNLEAPCNNCHSCQLMNAKSHPDFLLLEPEQVGGMIKIDQIRDLIQITSETALQGNNRVVIIHPASAMNISSANALLKTLEEPGPNTFFILVNDQIGRLSPTILSRCQKIIFNKPTSEVAYDWLANEYASDEKNASFSIALKLADHAPLKAKYILENDFLNVRQTFYNHLDLLNEQKIDPLQLAVEYQDQDIRVLLDLLMVWVQDLIRQQVLVNPTLSKHLFHYYDHIKQLNSYLLSHLNLNRQLMLEELFVIAKQIFTPQIR